MCFGDVRRVTVARNCYEQMFQVTLGLCIICLSSQRSPSCGGSDTGGGTEEPETNGRLQSTHGEGRE